MAARFAYHPTYGGVGLLATPGAAIVLDSELASMPRGNLLTQSPARRWRTKTGWTIKAGENDQLPFNRGGNKVATIAAGYYATAAALCVAIVAALEAADAPPIWACSYSGVTFKFTISADLAFVLLFLTGTNVDASIHPDLGYTSTDKGSATSVAAENTSYQSRHTINVDFGSPLAVTTGLVTGHSITAAGTVRMDGFTATMVGVGLGGAVPDYLATLSGTGARSVFMASQSKRYLRLIITDVQNAAGFVELGVWFAGTYGQPTVSPAVQYSKDNEHLSEISFADGGAHHQVLRTRRRVYKLLFQLEQRAGMAVADRALFDAIDALGIGTNLFMTFDHPDGSVVTVYGFNRVGLHEVYVQGTLWAIVMEFAEALG